LLRCCCSRFLASPAAEITYQLGSTTGVLEAGHCRKGDLRPTTRICAAVQREESRARQNRHRTCWPGCGNWASGPGLCWQLLSWLPHAAAAVQVGTIPRMAGCRITPVLVFWTFRVWHWVEFTI
jgi:hypothetical protein